LLDPDRPKIEVPEWHMLEVKTNQELLARSSLLLVRVLSTLVILGELYVNLHNIGRSTQVIPPGHKIAQVILVPIVTCGIQQVFRDIADKGTSRGSGGFGSTGEY